MSCRIRLRGLQGPGWSLFPSNREGPIAKWHLCGFHDGTVSMAVRARRKKVWVVSLFLTTAPKTRARQNFSSSSGM